MVLSNAERQARYRATAKAARERAAKLERFRVEAISRTEKQLASDELSLSQMQDGSLTLRSRTAGEDWKDVTAEIIETTKSSIRQRKAFIKRLRETE